MHEHDVGKVGGYAAEVCIVASPTSLVHLPNSGAKKVWPLTAYMLVESLAQQG